METIPLIYGTVENNRLYAGNMSRIDGYLRLGETVPVSRIPDLRTREDRGIVIVVDTFSMNSGRFNPPFIERCKVSGNDVWLMETVYDGDDVLDAFLGNAEGLIIPYDTVRDWAVFKEALDLSDSCIPYVRCTGSLARGKDPVSLLERFDDMGFTRVMVEDTDGSVTDTLWTEMSLAVEDLVVYSPSRPVEARTVAVDLKV
ncbi:MAG: hypothetical protein MJZ68_05645 [archaeon]|nr:hypothetical protein [archaeon]